LPTDLDKSVGIFITMNTLLLNDTSDYHNGCVQVVKSYNFVQSIKTKDVDQIQYIDYSQYNKVILNGEGTMHNSSPTALKFLRALHRAQTHGCITEMRNSVWQNMPKSSIDALVNCNKVTVRESFSQLELRRKHGIESTVEPDRSMLIDVPFEQYEYIHVYRGQYVDLTRKYNDYPRIDIFNQSWEEIVNRLRHADLLITGRHHEMYAAIKARCKFIVSDGNTWKNRALLSMFSIPMGLSVDETLGSKYDSNFKDLFDWCNNESSSSL